jgi:peptidoglycan hydrolase CwlO-like protein
MIIAMASLIIYLKIGGMIMTEITNPIVKNGKNNSGKNFLNSILILVISLLVGGLIVWAGVRADVVNLRSVCDKHDNRLVKVEEKQTQIEKEIAGQLSSINEKLHTIDKRLDRIESERK